MRVCRACGERPAKSQQHWYCGVCRPAREKAAQARQSTVKRGYGPAHKKLREQVARLVEAGYASCARCGLPIGHDEPWDLGHDDADRTRYSGPEHQRCNRGTSGRRAA